MKIVILYFIYSVFAAATLFAAPPPPPWHVEMRGPTSAYEVTTYITDILPFLDAESRADIADILENAPSPVYALPRIDAARWRATIIPYAEPWDMSSRDDHAAAEHLRSTRAALGDQLDVFAADHAHSPPLTVAETIEALARLDELKTRVQSPHYGAFCLEYYTILYRLKGAPMTVFWWLQHMYWYEDKARTEPFLYFLIDPRNPDEFSVGAAHFFLGLLYEQVHQEYERAVTYYLRAVPYKTCLTFIGYAYYKAANLLYALGQNANALALLAVDVPSTDMRHLRGLKHMKSAHIYLHDYNFTNGVRHLHAALRVNVSLSNNVNALVRAFPYAITTSLWHTTRTHFWRTDDRDAAIIAGLTNAIPTPDDDAFLMALSLDWPPPEDLPTAIVTNRVLNNVVFSVPQRSLPPLSRTPSSHTPSPLPPPPRSKDARKTTTVTPTP